MARIPDAVALNVDASEPLLPIEKALVGWSFIASIALIIVFAATGHILP